MSNEQRTETPERTPSLSDTENPDDPLRQQAQRALSHFGPRGFDLDECWTAILRLRDEGVNDAEIDDAITSAIEHDTETPAYIVGAGRRIHAQRRPSPHPPAIRRCAKCGWLLGIDCDGDCDQGGLTP